MARPSYPSLLELARGKGRRGALAVAAVGIVAAPVACGGAPNNPVPKDTYQVENGLIPEVSLAPDVADAPADAPVSEPD